MHHTLSIQSYLYVTCTNDTSKGYILERDLFVRLTSLQQCFPSLSRLIISYAYMDLNQHIM